MNSQPATFRPLDRQWSLKALNPDVVPEPIRHQLAAGIPAQVPGEASLDLLRAGLIDDPFDGDNESQQQWIGDVDWQFGCNFTWHENGDDRHDLVAYGLDTVAAVMLNGRLVGYTQNFHRSYRWDVRDKLKEGLNKLVVTFVSPVREAERREHRLGYYSHTEHHSYNQLRKPGYQFGWDWGVDGANAGIVRPIGIDSWSDVRLDEVRPLVDVRSDGTGVLTAHVRVERSGDEYPANTWESRKGLFEVPVSVHVMGNGADITVEGVIEAGRREQAIAIEVPNVKLWWPVGYGDHPLYDVVVETGEGGAAHWRGRVGFRTVRVDTRADATGRPFQLYVNEIPVHARGYNWIPSDAYISRSNRDTYAARFRDLVESNSNMVRVWGGGIYEYEDFYDLADELGVMVWQDFCFACASYPEDAGNRAEIEAEAHEQIVRLSPHPSLVVWNGSNENYVGHSQWAGTIQAQRDDDLKPSAYGYGEKPWGDLYYSKVIPSLLDELDSTRVYLPSSPMSFTQYADPNRDTDGTMHIWDVWNDVDYRHYADYTPRFADEFGYQAPPAWSTLNRVVHDSEFDPFGLQMLVHQKANMGNYKLARGMRGHLTAGDINDVSVDGDGNRDWLIPSDRWEDGEDWHWACQLQQAQAIRFGVEYMRSLEPVNAGMLIWQLNDDWPVTSWAAVDYDGHRKPLWYASRDFFEPRLASIQPHASETRRNQFSWEGSHVDPDRLVLSVANDTKEPWSGTWHVERMTLGSRVLASQDVSVSLEPLGHAVVLLNESVGRFDDVNSEIILAVPLVSDSVRGTSTFARVVYNPAEVIDQNLNPSPLEVDAARVPGGYRLHVNATAYARDVFCMVDKIDPHARVDKGMLTLLPGESVDFAIVSDADVAPDDFARPNVLRTANDLKTISLR